MIDIKTGNKYLGVNYEKIIPYLVDNMQNLNKKIELQNDQINILNQKIKKYDELFDTLINKN